MDIQELVALQRDNAAACMNSLSMAGRRKYLHAAHLLEITGPAIDRLANFGGSERIDHSSVLSALAVLTTRYNETFFTSQQPLFGEIEIDPFEKWMRYFHGTLVPFFLADDGIVRNVLRATDGLASRSMGSAADALRHEFVEMHLPRRGAHTVA